VNGHVIICHGLESSPEATKASALAAAAEALGWSHARPDFRAWDDDQAAGRLGDVHGRLAHLQALAAPVAGPLVLAGSSLGAFIAARVSLSVPVRGLFLMAPPPWLEGYGLALEAATVPTRIVHGWDDELIPAQAVVDWAQSRRACTTFVDDGHRLAEHVDFCAEEFSRLLRSLA